MDQPGSFIAPLFAVFLPLAIVTGVSSLFYKKWGVFWASTTWVGLGVLGWVALLCFVGQPDSTQAIMALKELTLPTALLALTGSLFSGMGGHFFKRSPWLGSFLGGALGVSIVCFYILYQAMQQSISN